MPEDMEKNENRIEEDPVVSELSKQIEDLIEQQKRIHKSLEKTQAWLAGLEKIYAGKPVLDKFRVDAEEVFNLHKSRQDQTEKELMALLEKLEEINPEQAKKFKSSFISSNDNIH